MHRLDIGGLLRVSTVLELQANVPCTCFVSILGPFIAGEELSKKYLPHSWTLCKLVWPQKLLAW